MAVPALYKSNKHGGRVVRAINLLGSDRRFLDTTDGDVLLDVIADYLDDEDDVDQGT